MSGPRSARIFRSTPSLVALVLLLAVVHSAPAAVGVRVSLLDHARSNPLTRPGSRGLSAFRDHALLDIGVGPREMGASFDSLYTRATYTEQVAGTNLTPPVLMDYEDYARYRMAGDIERTLREERVKSYKAASRRVAGEGLAIDLPYRIKSKTFRRLFGGDNVGVRVQGNISINGSLRRQKFDELQNTTQRNTNTNFRIDMIQQFTITGKIGQKVEVKVDQDSERMFDFENSLKLTYTGDEDEIIQKVEAGNVALNLGTKLATFSGRNTGLFGLKTQAKVGALNLTGIASLERGQKNRQSPNQRTSQASFTEREFLRGHYFFVTTKDIAGDGRVVPNFRENYRRYQGRVHIAVPQQQQIRDIELYVSISGTDPSGQELNGRAAALDSIQNLSAPSFQTTGDDQIVSNWKRLQKDVEYTVDPQLGLIRLKQALPEGQALAAAFMLNDSSVFGTLPAREDSTALVLLFSKSPDSTDATWNNALRNVYYMNATNLDKNNFKLTIIRNTSGTLDETGPPGRPETYLQYFDFDEEGTGGTGGPDGQLDDVPAVVRWDLGELHFLDLTPFNPTGYINDGTEIRWDLAALDEQYEGGFLAPWLYRERKSQIDVRGSLWRFQTEFKGSSSVFDLGPLVLEGSEEVTLNGQPLMRGTDYSIDYMSGQLRILNEAAKAPGAALDITYESGRVFQLDKTTLLGARAEYDLWENSYIGGMWLYLNQKTLDRRVRIGNEPIRNTLYDMNTSLKFKPNFLTTVVNALPLIRTEAPSEITIDGEVARVFPNPNSLENPRTGDYNGLAFIDDFEGSRRGIPLGLSRRMWTPSSLPIDHDIDRRRGRFRWYNPSTRDQVPVKEVFPEREVNSQVANTLQSIVFEFTPDPGSDGADTARSWGGVMRYLGEGYSDQSRAQFLEFWVELPLGEVDPAARLVVDLGILSEDAIPNDTLNTEDDPIRPCSSPLQECGNGLLNPDEDLGLDHNGGPDPADSAYWNGPDQPPVPSWDDWQYEVNSSNFERINGTEGNRTDEGGGYPDTEDLDNNDNLGTENSYYSYTFYLNEDEANRRGLIVGGNYRAGSRWRLYRIPVQTNDPELRRRVGAGDLTNVRWARVYMTGVKRTTKVQLVQMDIVANEWQAPSNVGATDTTEWVSAAVINTHENPGYFSPPGVEGDIDPITNLRQREQSLVLKINALDRDTNTVDIPEQFFVAKNLYEYYNLLEYKRLKMFVHGGDSLEAANFHDGTYQLILRLGQSYEGINRDYYDIVTDVAPGWDPRNQIEVTLGELADMNRLRAVAFSDTVQYPDANPTGRFAYAYRPDQPGDSLVVEGNPTLSRVGFIALGVRITDKGWVGRNHEIWVDELRVSDIYKDAGTAAELNTAIRIADFITLDGGFRSTDADFHNVNTRINAAQASSDAWRGNATVNLHKALFENAGVRLPLTFGYNQSTSIPRVVPGTDRRISPAEAPDTIKAIQTSYNYGLRFSKGGNSKNPLVRWTLEKFTASWDYAWDERTDYNIRQSTTEQTGAQAAYTFPTARGRGVAPLFWMQRVPLLRRLGNPRFYYKPTKLQVNAGATDRSAFQVTRSGQTTGSALMATTRSLNTGFEPFEQITVDFTRSHKGQLYSRDWVKLLQYDFGKTNEITQNLTNTYTPQLASWLRPTFNYTASYSWGTRNAARDDQQAITNQRNIGADFTLDFVQIFGGGSGRGGRRDRNRGRDRGAEGRQGEQGIPRPEDMGELGRGLPPGEMMPGGPFGRPEDEPPRPERPEEHREREAEPPPPVPAPGDTLAATPDTTGARDTTAARPRGPRLSALGVLGRVLNPMKAALMKIDPIALSYDNTARHGQSGTIGQADLPYQLGFTQEPGLRIAEGYNATPTRGKNEDITARSGLRLTQNIRTSFNYAHRASENVTSFPTGNVEQTTFWLSKKGGGDVTAIPFVDLSLDVSGLEKIAFLSKVTKTVSLQTAIANKVRENWANARSNVETRDYNRQFNPLIGVNIAWKGDIDSQLRYNSSSTFTNSLRQGNRSRTSDNRISGTVSYTLRTGFRLPLPFLRRVRLENQTTFSMTVDYGGQKTETSELGRDYAVTQQTSSWSASPRMRYSFSNTVQGEGYVQIQQNKNVITDSKSRVFEFGIQVNIAIRG